MRRRRQWLQAGYNNNKETPLRLFCNCLIANTTAFYKGYKSGYCRENVYFYCHYHLRFKTL